MSDHSLTNHVFNGSSVRVVLIEDDPWFVAADVCKVLGFNTPQQAYARLDKDEKRYVSRTDLGISPGKPMVVLSESGLYDLIFQSRKAEAKEFQRWVRKEVLPAIRKDGGYIMGEEKVRAGEMSEDELVLKAVNILQTKVERLTSERDEAIQQRDTIKTVVGSQQHTLARFVRTLPGINANKTKSDLLRLGYLYKRAGVYRVYAKARTWWHIEPCLVS